MVKRKKMHNSVIITLERVLTCLDEVVQLLSI